MHAWAEVCHLLQSSKSPLTGFLCSIGWSITGFLQTLPAHEHYFQFSNSCVIITIRCYNIMWFVRMRTREEKNDVVKEAILQAWKKAMGWFTAQWKMLLFCAKTIVKESRKFELARLKKKKKVKHFGRLVTFWFGTFAMLFSATGCVVRHENTRRWTVECYNGL